MNNLDDLKEQIQEDIITYLAPFESDNPEWIGDDITLVNDHTTDICQIIVDRVNELKNSTGNK